MAENFVFSISMWNFKEGSSRNMYKGPIYKAKGGKVWEWEGGVGRAGESGGRKMETTLLEQQFFKNLFMKKIKTMNNKMAITTYISTIESKKTN